MPAKRESAVAVESSMIGDIAVLTVDGVLDGTTYIPLRDDIIKAAIDEPRAVIVDVSALVVPRESAWAVFTSASWLVSRWPAVPVLLVCGHAAGRSAIRRNGIVRYVPVYEGVPGAVDALDAEGGLSTRRRIRTTLPAVHTSVLQSQLLVTEWLTAWSQPDYIPVAKVVVTVLVDNVIKHTQSAPVIRLEGKGSVITLVVEDLSGAVAGVHEDPRHGADIVSGLAIIGALTRVWGSTPTSTGKAVWAVLGPENQL